MVAAKPYDYGLRLRDLNKRHMIDRTLQRNPTDRPPMGHFPLSPEEQRERQRILNRGAKLKSRWDNMEPMTPRDLEVHRQLNGQYVGGERVLQTPETMTDRQKAKHFLDLNGQIADAHMNQTYGDKTRNVTPRQLHEYETLGGDSSLEGAMRNRLHPGGWAEGHFGNMQNDAKEALARMDDYERTGRHPDGSTSLEGYENAHDRGLTHLWSAETLRDPNAHPALKERALDHYGALSDMAEQGPFGYSSKPGMKHTHEALDDAESQMHLELQHRGRHAVPDTSELSPIENPWERNGGIGTYTGSQLVNPRWAEGTGDTTGDPTIDAAARKAYQVNCQRATLAAEARYRGHNVEAQGNMDVPRGTPNASQQFNDHDIASWFPQTDARTPKWIDAEDAHPDVPQGPGQWDAMHEAIKGWGPGARGMVAVTYPGVTGATQRHIFNTVVNDKGVPEYHDHQTGRANVGDGWRSTIGYGMSSPHHAYERQAAANDFANDTIDHEDAAWQHNLNYSPLRYMRTDDKLLDPTSSRHMVDRGTLNTTPVKPPVTGVNSLF